MIRCHERKSNHIGWTLGLKCDHRVWSWSWPWTSVFKVKYGIGYISAKNGAIAMRRIANISIDRKASNMTIGFDLGNDLDLEFSRSNMELAISLPKMVQLSQNEKQTYQSVSRPQMWPSDFNLGHDLDLEFSKSNMEFAISQPKVVRLPRNEKQTYRLNTRPQMWSMGLTLAMTLISEFSRSNVILTIWWPRSGVMIYHRVIGWLQMSGAWPEM